MLGCLVLSFWRPKRVWDFGVGLIASVGSWRHSILNSSNLRMPSNLLVLRFLIIKYRSGTRMAFWNGTEPSGFKFKSAISMYLLILSGLGVTEPSPAELSLPRVFPITLLVSSPFRLVFTDITTSLDAIVLVEGALKILVYDLSGLGVLINIWCLKKLKRIFYTSLLQIMPLASSITISLSISDLVSILIFGTFVILKKLMVMAYGGSAKFLSD